MTGKARASFECGAKVEPVHYGSYVVEGICGDETEVDLINDGQYTNFNTPEGWHIELGVFDPSKTIVRCPRHCEWKYPRGAPELGFWEDAE